MSVELPEVKPTLGIGHLQNSETGMCLDWGNIIVDVLPCFSTRRQQLFEYNADSRRITTSEIGERKARCLDSGGKYLHVWKCLGGADPSPKQSWKFDSARGVISQGEGKDAKCLAAARKALWLQPCSNGGKLQHWQLGTPAKAPCASTTTTTVRTTTSSSSVSSSTGTASTTSGASNSTTGTDRDEMMDTVKVIHFPNVCLSTTDDLKLKIDTCDKSNRFQHWGHNSAFGTLVSPSGHCLDAEREGLLASCESARVAQAWGISRDTGQILTEGGLCLDALWPHENGSNVHLSPCRDDHMGQKWFMEHV